MKTKTRQNAKSSDELQVVKNETERGNAGSKQARLVLVRCAELQTIDPKTKNSQSGQSVISRSRPPRSPLSTGSQSGSATKTFHVSLHRSQCHKNTCISLRDTALAGINYRQSGGGTRTWRAAGGYVRHIADNLSCIVRNLYNTTYTSPPQDTGGQVSFVCLSPHARQQNFARRRQDGTGPRTPADRRRKPEPVHRSTRRARSSTAFRLRSSRV